MRNFKCNLSILVLVFYLLSFISCQTNKQNTSSTLVMDSTSRITLDTIFPNTPLGKMVKEHIRVAMGNGENAESGYQKSLLVLRADTGSAETLFNVYNKVPEQNFFLRTMLVESLKELHSSKALFYLSSVAKEKIPANLYPENAEINTTQDEIIIRITAVEGISKLAADSSAEAEGILTQLINSEDLTIRQMAVRGYLHSAFGNANEKMEQLRRKLPKEEYWYITTDTTNIRKVKHPDMPAEFKLKSKNSSNAPKIKNDEK